MKKKNGLLVLLLWLSLWFGVTGLHAAITTYEFEDDLKREQFQSIIAELRCPKCQNQNIADSDAPVAQDIKTRVFELIQSDKTSEEIIAYMVDRYGDFITYRPPLKPATWILWFGPPVVILLIAIVLLTHQKRLNPIEETLVDQEKLKRILEDNTHD